MKYEADIGSVYERKGRIVDVNNCRSVHVSHGHVECSIICVRAAFVGELHTAVAQEVGRLESEIGF